MSHARNLGLFLFSAILAAGIVPLRAQERGQADLDEATALQVQARSLADLEQVAKLCDSALRKGLAEGNRKFAEQLLSSTLFEHATRLCAPFLVQTPGDQRWLLLRKAALADLERVVKLEPQLGDAHLLIGRLQALPGGDRERGQAAAEAAVKLFEGGQDHPQQAAALVIRAQFREEAAERLQDYDRAIELDPGNAAAWQARALICAEQGEWAKAAEDFNQLLKDHDENATAHLALGEVLTNLEKYDEASKHIERAIQLQPESPLGYTLRAQLHLARKDVTAAMTDLDQALRVEPRDVWALLMRAELHQEAGDLDAAKDDVDRVLGLHPELPEGLIMCSIVEAAQGHLLDAIADMELVLKSDPASVPWRLQLASYYVLDKRPHKAIQIFTQLLEEDQNNWIAREERADTFLSLGKHAEAIADLELVLQQRPDEDRALNNLAWVLATSPEDQLRNGRRAVKLAQKACKLTEYKQSYILSTLAAAYAERGDFETAKKWSKKALELGAGDKEVDDQLKQEWQSYKRKKPWRERQQVKEKGDPVQTVHTQFET